MNEKHCIDLLAGYALEILDGEDRLTAEEHLQLCTACREEMESLRETLHLFLGRAAPQEVPGQEVRTQFLARFAEEVVPPEPAATSPEHAPASVLAESPQAPSAQPIVAPLPVPRRQLFTWALYGAVLPAVAAVIFCVLFVRSQNQLSDQQHNALTAAISSPHSTMHLSGIAVNAGMSGEVLMQHQSGTGILIVSGIRTVPTGMSYTCWVRKHGQWMDGGVLQPDASGMAMVPLQDRTNLSDADLVAVTMEPTTNPRTPSGEMLLTTKI
jgi:anti-sigma-K factor RskA